MQETEKKIEIIEIDREIVPVDEPEPAEAAEPAEAVEGDLKEKWLRAAAELENLRKRSAAQIAAVRIAERRALLTELLGVLDNVERALEAFDNESTRWMEGVEAIQKQMLDLLGRYGATPFESMGESFDPHRHEAVAVVHLPEKPQGAIADVTEVGYAMEDGTILRPAKVIVVRNESSRSEQER